MGGTKVNEMLAPAKKKPLSIWEAIGLFILWSLSLLYVGWAWENTEAPPPPPEPVVVTEQ